VAFNFNRTANELTIFIDGWHDVRVLATEGGATVYVDGHVIGGVTVPGKG
jgi:uncharacterized protein GlcG (DUF336 family)